MSVTYRSVVKALGDHGFHPVPPGPGQHGTPATQRFVSQDPAYAGKPIVLPNVSPDQVMPPTIVNLVKSHAKINDAAFVNGASTTHAVAAQQQLGSTTSVAGASGVKQQPVKSRFKLHTPS